jgi:hypothetical protein
VNPSGDHRDVAVSDDGRWLAWCEPGRLRLVDLSRPGASGPRTPAKPGAPPAPGVELAIALESPFQLALSSVEPERLLVVQARSGGTVVRVFALPDLREIVEASLGVKGEAHLVAQCGQIALLLGGTESLTAIDVAKLRAIPLAARGPIQVVAPLSPDQVLVGARGKLEAWSIPERRPTHRLGLPLPRDAASGGVVAGGRLLWVTTTGALDALSVFRLADGKQLASVDAGGPIKAVAGARDSATVVAAVQPEGAARQLVALELETGAHRVVVAEPAVAAFDLIGDAGESVAVLHDQGSPVVLSLGPASTAPYQSGPALALEALASPAPALVSAPALVPAPAGGAASGARTAESLPAPAAALAASTPAPNHAPEAAAAPDAGSDLAARLSQWRAQVQAAVVAAPPRRSAPDARSGGGDGEPRSRSRAELYAWGQSARARTTTTPPPPPQGWKLTELAARFHLDMRSRSLLAMLYASWLHGEGDVGLPVGILARALGNDEDAWVEALGQGRLGEMAWVKSRRGRTRLRGVVGRFLDEAAPRVAIIAPPEDASPALVPPAAPALWALPVVVLDAAALEAGAREVAAALGAPVALIDAAALPADRRDAALASRLLEARLHGALPILAPCEAAPIPPRLLEGPALVAVVAPPPAAWRALPLWPEALPAPPEVAAGAAVV